MDSRKFLEIPMIRRLAAVCLLLLLAFPARADDYVKPGWPNLVRTMIHLNALDTGDDTLIDEYALITECKLYQNFYTDDFKWNQVRAAIRDSIQKHSAEFPVAYGYKNKVQLDRYDFKERLFHFTNGTVIQNVNAFLLYQTEGPDCDKARIKYVPKSFRAVLEIPFSIYGLPMQPDDAEKLLQQMKETGNNARVVYARFNLHVMFAEQLRKNFMQSGPETYSQGGRPPSDPFKFDAHLDSVEFFTDEDMTKLIYTFTP
jgi:hypothetical protein